METGAWKVVRERERVGGAVALLGTGSGSMICMGEWDSRRRDRAASATVPGTDSNVCPEAVLPAGGPCGGQIQTEQKKNATSSRELGMSFSLRLTLS